MGIRSFLRNSLSQFGVLLITLLEKVVLVALMAKIWTSEVYANWISTHSLASLLCISTLGIALFAGNEVQKKVTTEGVTQASILSKRLATLFLIMIALNLLVALSLVCLAFALSAKSFHQVALASLMIVWVISISARGFFYEVMRGFGYFSEGVQLHALAAAATLIIATTLVARTFDPILVVAGILVSEFIFGWICSVARFVRIVPSGAVGFTLPTKAVFLRFLRHWPPLAALQTLSTALIAVPILLAGATGLTAQALVTFFIVRTLVSLVRQIPQIFGIAIAVDASRLAKSTVAVFDIRGNAVQNMTVQITALMIAFPLLWGKDIIWLWLGGADYYDPKIMLWMLSPLLLFAVAYPRYATYTLSGRPMAEILCKVAALALGTISYLTVFAVGEVSVFALVVCFSVAELVGLLALLFFEDLKELPQRITELCLGVFLMMSTIAGSIGIFVALNAVDYPSFGAVFFLSPKFLLWVGLTVALIVFVSLLLFRKSFSALSSAWKK